MGTARGADRKRQEHEFLRDSGVRCRGGNGLEDTPPLVTASAQGTRSCGSQRCGQMGKSVQGESGALRATPAKRRNKLG